MVAERLVLACGGAYCTVESDSCGSRKGGARDSGQLGLAYCCVPRPVSQPPTNCTACQPGATMLARRLRDSIFPNITPYLVFIGPDER